MKKTVQFLLLFSLLISYLNVLAQYDPDKICRIEEGRIIFSLNLKWSEKEKKEISTQFDLDSTLLVRVYKGETNFALDGENWKVARLKGELVELSKALSSNAAQQATKTNDVLLLIDAWMNFTGNREAESVTFGVNRFEIAHTFQYNKTAWFYLAGNKTARNVYISGSFNGWSTSLNPMKRVDSGWTVDLELKPGKYTYKFIIDGKWIHDPYNKLKEKDGAGGYNSVVYCPNHLFKLKGSLGAQNVAVAGNFNNWKQGDFFRTKTVKGWILPVYLREGTYTYKFVIGNQWYTDPVNPVERKDGQGNINSVLSIGNPYLFQLEGFTDAQKVFLTGSFNGWNGNELLMDKTSTGWQIPYIIPAGNHEYKFVVDGKWITDPANPFSTGSGNYENSFLALKANHLFELENQAGAKEVIVTGSFNGWSKTGYRMAKKEGKWVFPICLNPGKHTYKFIVDGAWMHDPANELYEKNEVGTFNSILWIKQ